MQQRQRKKKKSISNIQSMQENTILASTIPSTSQTTRPHTGLPPNGCGRCPGDGYVLYLSSPPNILPTSWDLRTGRNLRRGRGGVTPARLLATLLSTYLGRSPHH
ncbi:hypothetical protein L249_5055, partial [Ophiocordyceps polyrhachis-furcata BCC 54312]